MDHDPSTRLAPSALILSLLAAAGCGPGSDGGMTAPPPASSTNEAPAASIASPEDDDQFLAGELIPFEGSADDPEDGALTGDDLSWASDRDGSFGTGEAFQSNSLSPGEHVITLTATDSEGATGTDEVSIVVQDVTPVAEITSPPDGATFEEGETVLFEGSGEDTQDGVLTGGRLTWSSSLDGALGTGESFTRANLSVGDHTITLTATDSDGNTATATVSVTVEEKDPTAEITAPADGATFAEGDPIDFEGSADDPQDGALTAGSLVWDSDRDGQIGTGGSFTRDDLSAGDHVITLTATDADGNTAEASVNITVEPAGPGPSSGVAYVANRLSGDVAVVDVATGDVETYIQVADQPTDVAFTPDGSTAYVTGQGAVNVIDASTNTGVDAITALVNGPWGVAFSPDGGTAYVTNAATLDEIVVIDVATRTAVTAFDAGGDSPRGIVLTPDGSTAYVALSLDNAVSVVDLGSNSVTATIGVGAGPLETAITPDGSTVLVNNIASDDLSFIDVASNTVTATVAVGDGPADVAVSPDGSTAYVSNEISGTVSVIDVASAAVTATVDVGGAPRGLAVSPDGSTLWVTLAGPDEVALVDVATQTVTGTITIGDAPVGLAPSAVTFRP